METKAKSEYDIMYDNYKPLVVKAVRTLIKCDETVKDVTQDVFIKVYRKMKHFRGESKLSTWVAKIAYKTSISHVRKPLKNEHSYDESPELIANERDEELNQIKIEKEQAKKYLLEMIEELPVHYRTVLTLFHLEEFSYKEIEEITEMPEGTIKSYLSRARKILKEKLEKVVETEKTNIFTDYV